MTQSHATPMVRKASIGFDFSGNPVIATFTKTSHNLEVRFEGIVKPTNSLTIRPKVKLLRDASGGWYVDCSLVAAGFRFEGGWNIPFNAPGLQGKRRLFQSRGELEAMLVDGGYLVAADETAPSSAPGHLLVANMASVGAAAAALSAHREALGIEGDEQVQLWQLVASLYEFAGAQGINLRDTVDDVRRHIKARDFVLPAAASVLAKEEQSV